MTITANITADIAANAAITTDSSHAPGSRPAEAAGETPVAELAPTLQRLRQSWQAGKPGYEQRRADLQRLREALKRRLEEMAATIAEDFGQRSRHESLIADGMTVLNEIDHLRGQLRKWMKPRRVGVGWRFWPARAEVRSEPVGVVGVISPWNYPVNLALIPLATAIAAGNHVYLKPSEHTPNTTDFLRGLLAEVFPADRVAVAAGGAEVAGAFAALPFDHLVFTGSTAVGRKVMAAAAPNLTPLTLELGGKSPAIVCADFPVEQAAARLATGKWFNGGQTCIAPDYVLIDEGRAPALAEALREQVRARYGTLADSTDYTRIINDGQYARLEGYLEDARARGLQVLALGQNGAAGERLFAPTLVLEPGDDATVMQEEIFGPILPIKSYRNLEEAIAYVNAHDRPLSLYPFSHDRAKVEQILRSTLAGGVTVNDTVLHFGINNLPFGGIGPSGMGAYHGRAGFDAFSKALPILWQPRRAGSDMLKPPYSKVARFIDFIIR
ncbi:MAG: coniferyl aldehyde dehydrogenase [Pseudoxanthomonas sp.]